MRLYSLIPVVAMALSASACSTGPQRPVPRAPEVDVPRFMGDWYVIAQIPTFIERKAFDSVERYALRDDGRIQTTFTYRKGSFDAPVKTMHPVGRVEKEGNGALWGMQFIWPIQAEYVISWLDADYQQTIVARSKRDYVWYMARTPQVSDSDYEAAMQRIASMGYDISKIRKVPQSKR